MKILKSKYYILFIVLAMLTGVFAWPQGICKPQRLAIHLFKK